MNLQLAYSDAYLATTEARVVAVETGEKRRVVLDRTVFYPGGGGLPTVATGPSGRPASRRATSSTRSRQERTRRRSVTSFGWISTGRAGSG
jgi:hypothetical protein